MNSVLLMAPANNSLNSSESEAEQRKHIHLSAHTFRRTGIEFQNYTVADIQKGSREWRRIEER